MERWEDYMTTKDLWDYVKHFQEKIEFSEECIADAMKELKIRGEVK
jgi:NADPH-dependent 7-cyano-7-deazaguanine reductase QueF